MSRITRGLTCLCAAVLVMSLVLLGTPASADEITIYLMAENDQMLNLPVEAMPTQISGELYVPYSAFDWTQTKVNLGVSYGLGQTDSTYKLTLYSLSGVLVFDLNAGTCVERDTGEDMGMKAVLRNGLPFVPLAGVCRYFELRYSYTPTNYGTLVRITNGQEKMDTALFVQSASNSTAMRSRYYEYLRQLTGGTASPSPSDSSPAPSQTGGGEGNQSQHLTVRLAIRYTGEDTQALLELLEEQGISALFLLSPQQLAQAGDSLRQMVGSGHAIGLAVPGNSREEALAALEVGSAQLEGMLLLRTHTAYLEDASNAVLQAVEAAGWACWQDGLDARPDGGSLSSQRANLLARLEGRRGAVDLLLDDSEDGVSLLRQALPRMEQLGCTFSLAVETRLF